MLFTFIALLIIAIACYNLPIGYSIAIMAKLLIPEIVLVNLGVTTMGFHPFILGALIFIWYIKKGHQNFTSFKQFAFKRKNAKQIRTDIGNKTIFSILATYVCVLFIFMLIPSEVSFTFSVKSFYYEMQGLALAAMALVIFNQPKQINIFFKMLIAAALIMCVYAIIEYVLKVNLYITLISLLFNDGANISEMFAEETRGILQGRVQSTTMHPLTFGQITHLLLALFLIQNNNLRRKIQLIPILLIGICSFLSGSRTIFICVMLLLFCYIYKKRERTKLKIAMYSIGAIMLLTCSLSSKQLNILTDTISTFTTFWKDSSEQKVEIQGSSKEMRFRQFEYTIERLGVTHFLTGLGNGFILEEKKEIGSHPIMCGYESIFYSYMTEQGLIGLVAFIMFIYKLYKVGVEKLSILKAQKIKWMWGSFFATYFLSLIMTGNMNSVHFFYVFVFVIIKYYNLNILLMITRKVNDRNLCI